MFWIFLAAGAVALFSFLSVAHWAETRKAERIAVERLGLYRKLAESPSETAEAVLARLREEDDRRERDKLAKAQKARADARFGGVLVMVVGVGFGIFLKAIVPGEAIWTLGLIPVLVGLVIVVSARPDKRLDA